LIEGGEAAINRTTSGGTGAAEGMLVASAGALDSHRSRLFQWNDLQRLLLGGFRLPGYSEDEIQDAVGHSGYQSAGGSRSE